MGIWVFCTANFTHIISGSSHWLFLMPINVMFVDVAPFYGGAQRSLYGLVSHLNRKRFRSFVMSGDGSTNGLTARCKAIGVEATFLPVQPWRRNLSGLLRARADFDYVRPKIRDWIGERRIDLVYANGLRSGLLCAMTLPRTVPLIFHHRDYHGPRLIVKYVVRRANRTITVSDFVREHCARIIGPRQARKLSTVYNGFDFAAKEKLRDAYSYRKRFDVSDDIGMIALVADMEPWKRHELFLSAIGSAVERDPRLFALVVGGPRYERVQAYEAGLIAKAEAMGIVEHLAFTGNVDNAMPLIDACDVLVSVAANEPFGRTVVEALGCGKPVVVVRGGGPEEITRNCPAASIVAARPDAIAAACLDWIERSADGDRIACAARKWAARFSIERHTRAVRRIIEVCLS